MEIQTVRLAELFEPVGRNQSSGARHIAHRHSRIARQIALKIFRQQPCLGVDAASGWVTHDDLIRFAFEEVLAPCTSGANDDSDTAKHKIMSLDRMAPPSQCSSKMNNFL